MGATLFGWVAKPPPGMVALVLAATCCGGPVTCAPLFEGNGAAGQIECDAAAKPVSARRDGGTTVVPPGAGGTTIPGGKSLLGAASTNDVFAIAALLDRGDDIDQVNLDGRTPLFCAAFTGMTEAALLLIDRGADVNRANAAGDTPLLWAAAKGDLRLVTALLDHRADPNLATKLGHTPLLRAINGVHVDVASLLLDRGADPDIVGLVDYGTACVTSEEFHQRGERPAPEGWPTTTALAVDVESHLRSRGTAVGLSGGGGAARLPGCPSSGNTRFLPVGPLAAATYLFQPSLVAKMLDHGADPDVAAFEAFTPLYVAAVLGDDQAAAALLAKGADPEPAIERVRTPWVAACEAGHLTTARLIGTAVWAARGPGGALPVACPPPLAPADPPSGARPSGSGATPRGTR